MADRASRLPGIADPGFAAGLEPFELGFYSQYGEDGVILYLLHEIGVRCPRVRDRGAGETGLRIRFTSAILPRYLRRAKSIEEVLPWLYPKGISTGDFCEALAALLGPEAPGLSASTIARLKEIWQGEMAHWQRRDLSAKRYVYFWADGVYFSPRLDHDKQCILVIIGADEIRRKELLAIADGYRESAQSWREVLLDLNPIRPGGSRTRSSSSPMALTHVVRGSMPDRRLAEPIGRLSPLT